MLESFGASFLALGPPLILVAGTAVTIAIAMLGSGPMRWWALAVGPALSLSAAAGGVFLVVEFIGPAEGSGFPLGGTAIGLYVAAMLLYYPVLAAVGIWRLQRNREAAGPG